MGDIGIELKRLLVIRHREIVAAGVIQNNAADCEPSFNHGHILNRWSEDIGQNISIESEAAHPLCWRAAGEGLGMEGIWEEVLIIAVTGMIAVRGLTYRDAIGNHPWLAIFFGFLALYFCLRVLLHNVLGVL